MDIVPAELKRPGQVTCLVTGGRHFADINRLCECLDIVLAESSERDEATLWHLLARVPPAERDRVFDRLARFVPPPPIVTRDGIREGRRDMLDRWWDAMGLGAIGWWRTWKVQAG